MHGFLSVMVNNPKIVLQNKKIVAIHCSAFTTQNVCGENMKNESKPETQDFFRETRKLEVRLEDYLKEEENFTQKIRNCISQLKALNASVENGEPKERVVTIKAGVIAALSEAMKLQGEAEHEKAHLMESYGALIMKLNEL